MRLGRRARRAAGGGDGIACTRRLSETCSDANTSCARDTRSPTARPVWIARACMRRQLEASVDQTLYSTRLTCRREGTYSPHGLPQRRSRLRSRALCADSEAHHIGLLCADRASAQLKRMLNATAPARASDSAARTRPRRGISDVASSAAGAAPPRGASAAVHSSRGSRARVNTGRMSTPGSRPQLLAADRAGRRGPREPARAMRGRKATADPSAPSRNLATFNLGRRRLRRDLDGTFEPGPGGAGDCAAWVGVA